MSIFDMLSSWRVRLIGVALIAAGSFWAGWSTQTKLCKAEVTTLKAQHDRDIGTARTDEQGKCKQRQQVTKEASNVYWKHIDDLNREHRAALERVRSDATKQCVRVPGAAGGSHEAGAGADFSGAAEVPAEPLIGLAADADQQRAQLIACQEYIRGALR